MQRQTAESATQALLEPIPSGLVAKLETTRQGMRQYLLTHCLLRLLLLELTLISLLALADWTWVLSGPVRMAGLGFLAAVALGVLYRGVILPRRRLARQDIATEVETTFPNLGQRVQTTLEYVEPTPATTPASPGLIRALTADTDRRTREMDFRHLIPWRSLVWPGLGLVLVLAGIGFFLNRYEELRTAALRVFLIPAHYTHLAVAPGDHTVKAGSNFAIQATIAGRPVATAELLYRSVGSEEEWTSLSLAPFEADAPPPPRKLAGTLETTLCNCQKDLEYRVVAGPIDSATYTLTVIHPLQLKQFEATIQPPAYTRKKPELVKEGNIKVIVGSKVRFRIQLDRAAETAQLRLFPPTGQKPEVKTRPPIGMAIEGNTLVAELAAVDQPLEYEVFAEAADGMRLDAGRFRIQVQPDRKPTIRFVKPDQQIEVTPTTEVALRLEAADDFGLAKVGIVYQVGAGPKKTLYVKEDPNQPVSVTLQSLLPLEEHPLNFQDSITYYAFAEDNHPTLPHRTSTELQFIDIRPYKRAYQLLKTGGS